MNPEEIKEVAKSVFNGNDSLLKSMRKFFYQIELDAVDLSNLQLNFGDKKILEAIKLQFLPELSVDLPIGSQRDILFEMDLKSMDPVRAVLHIRAIRSLERYFKQQFDLLEKGEFGVGKIRLVDLLEVEECTDDEAFIRTFTRLLILSHVEKNLMWLNRVANEKEKTPEELEEERKKNSLK